MAVPEHGLDDPETPRPLNSLVTRLEKFVTSLLFYAYTLHDSKSPRMQARVFLVFPCPCLVLRL